MRETCAKTVYELLKHNQEQSETMRAIRSSRERSNTKEIEDGCNNREQGGTLEQQGATNSDQVRKDNHNEKGRTEFHRCSTYDNPRVRTIREGGIHNRDCSSHLTSTPKLQAHAHELSEAVI